MKLIFYWIKSKINLPLKVLNYFKAGKTVESFSMTGRKFDNESEFSSNKKLCTEEKKEEAGKEKNVKKKRVAMLLSYLGDNYYGIQINRNFRTIEGELLSALHKADLIKATEVNEPYLIQFQITARTDKGVSAAKQVVCLQLAENSSTETINKHLPEDIRVLSIRRVTKSFSCQKECSARTYSYTLPTYALAPELITEYPEDYRISEETMQKVNELLISYIGTHNFHNFTIRKLPNDPSAKRFIMNFTAGEPFVQGEEFITLTVKGQSFMLHQIRKMIGHLIASLKGIAPPNIQTDIWTEKKYSVPRAPGLGLVLENVHFDWYNKKYESDGIHESLAWDDLANEVACFRKLILSNIIKKEIEEKLYPFISKYFQIDFYKNDVAIIINKPTPSINKVKVDFRFTNFSLKIFSECLIGFNLLVNTHMSQKCHIESKIKFIRNQFEVIENYD